MDNELETFISNVGDINDTVKWIRYHFLAEKGRIPFHHLCHTLCHLPDQQAAAHLFASFADIALAPTEELPLNVAISYSDVANGLQQQPSSSSMECTEEDYLTTAILMDLSGEGSVSFEDFISFMQLARDALEQDPSNARTCFNTFYDCLKERLRLFLPDDYQNQNTLETRLTAMADKMRLSGVPTLPLMALAHFTDKKAAENETMTVAELMNFMVALEGKPTESKSPPLPSYSPPPPQQQPLSSPTPTPTPMSPTPVLEPATGKNTGYTPMREKANELIDDFFNFASTTNVPTQTTKPVAASVPNPDSLNSVTVLPSLVVNTASTSSTSSSSSYAAAMLDFPSPPQKSSSSTVPGIIQIATQPINQPTNQPTSARPQLVLYCILLLPFVLHIHSLFFLSYPTTLLTFRITKATLATFDNDIFASKDPFADMSEPTKEVKSEMKEIVASTTATTTTTNNNDSTTIVTSNSGSNDTNYLNTPIKPSWTVSDPLEAFPSPPITPKMLPSSHSTTAGAASTTGNPSSFASPVAAALAAASSASAATTSTPHGRSILPTTSPSVGYTRTFPSPAGLPFDALNDGNNNNSNTTRVTQLFTESSSNNNQSASSSASNSTKSAQISQHDQKAVTITKRRISPMTLKPPPLTNLPMSDDSMDDGLDLAPPPPPPGSSSPEEKKESQAQGHVPPKDWNEPDPFLVDTAPPAPAPAPVPSTLPAPATVNATLPTPVLVSTTPAHDLAPVPTTLPAPAIVNASLPAPALVSSAVVINTSGSEAVVSSLSSPSTTTMPAASTAVIDSNSSNNAIKNIDSNTATATATAATTAATTTIAATIDELNTLAINNSPMKGHSVPMASSLSGMLSS